MTKIFITREVPAEIKRLLTANGHHCSEWTEKRDLSLVELIAAAEDCDGLFSIGSSPKLNQDFFSACDHLKVVALCSVGYDHVDIAAATSHGIPVSNTPGVLSKATADTAFLLMQNVARKAIHKHKEILRNNWGFFDPTADLGVDLQGKTLGIYGLGRIGYEMAKMCRFAFEMPVIYHNRGRNEAAEKDLGAKKVSFTELLQTSDVLSIHANLTDETREMFNLEAFQQMKPSSIFINTARGGLHNEPDLRHALETGLIWGAGLDVTNPEPMAADNPLLNMPTVAILPHIGSATYETRMEMMRLTAQNLLAGLNGQRLLSCVNPDVYGE